MIDVQRRTDGGWSTISTVATSSAGRATVVLAVPDGRHDFRLRVRATATAERLTTSARRITGVEGIATTISGWRTAAASAPQETGLGVSLRIWTGLKGQARVLAVQRRAVHAEEWTTVDTLTSESNGSAHVVLSGPAGAWEFRVIVASTRTAAAAATPARPVTLTLPDTTPPVVPHGLTAVVHDGQAWLAWPYQLDPDRDVFVVLRASASTGPWSEVARTASLKLRLPHTEADWFALEARDAAGNVSQPGTPVQASQLTLGPTVAAKYYSACAVDANGTTYCWGRDYGTSHPKEGAQDLGQIAMGWGHSCGLDDYGWAWCWGSDAAGQLGDDDGMPVPSERDGVRRVGCLGSSCPESFVQISAGGGSTCALDPQHHAWCWGQISGRGLEITHKMSYPTPAPGDHEYATLSVGEGYACAIDLAGQAWCWGYDDGRFGDGPGSAPAGSIPRAVLGGHVFTAIAAGEWHTCALDAEGVAWCWGRGTGGALGADLGGCSAGCVLDEPARVLGGHTFVTISVAASSTCAIDEAGATWCWGVFGDGPDAPPARRAAGHSFTAISVATSHVCGQDTSGAAWCWGANGERQLGVAEDAVPASSVPVKVPGLATRTP